jgi:hypothetical protein
LKVEIPSLFQGGNRLDVIQGVALGWHAAALSWSVEPQGIRRNASSSGIGQNLLTSKSAKTLPESGDVFWRFLWTMMDFGGVKVKETRHVMPYGRRADQQIRV